MAASLFCAQSPTSSSVTKLPTQPIKFYIDLKLGCELVHVETLSFRDIKNSHPSPFLFEGESVFPGRRQRGSSLSHIISVGVAVAPAAPSECDSNLTQSDSIPPAAASSSCSSSPAAHSSGIISLRADISEQGPHCSEDSSRFMTRKCVLWETGMETGQTGGGSAFTGRKDGCRRRKERETNIKEKPWNWIRWITLWPFLTVAACGSSPQAQCIVGFVLSASDGLVINSESLLGEVGRELPGLKRTNKS